MSNLERASWQDLATLVVIYLLECMKNSSDKTVDASECIEGRLLRQREDALIATIQVAEA
jgi:hypothetical protein